MIGLRLAILGVEIQRARRQGHGVSAVIDVVVEGLNEQLAFIGHGDARMPLKGHREKAVQIFYAAHRQHFRLPWVVVAETETKEISDRSFHAWSLLTVPIDA